MEVKPIHLVGAAIFAFVAIVAANLVSDAKRLEQFRETFSKRDFSAIRKQRVAEEQMTVDEMIESVSEE